jgi:hypothetical protein
MMIIPDASCALKSRFSLRIRTGVPFSDLLVHVHAYVSFYYCSDVFFALL